MRCDRGKSGSKSQVDRVRVRSSTVLHQEIYICSIFPSLIHRSSPCPSSRPPSPSSVSLTKRKQKSSTLTFSASLSTGHIVSKTTFPSTARSLEMDWFSTSASTTVIPALAATYGS